MPYGCEGSCRRLMHTNLNVFPSRFRRLAGENLDMIYFNQLSVSAT